MATTGYFDGPKSSKNWYARLEYSYTQTTSATNITLTLKVYDATGSSHNNMPNEAYYIIQGSKTYQTYEFNSIGWYTIASKTISVTDTSATSLAVSATWCSENETTWTPYSLSVSGTITFPQITPPTPPEPPEPPEPPTPTVNTISVQPIPDFIAGYNGDSFMITCNPSGGTGYTYKWYQGATNIATSQNITGTLHHNTDDNTYVYCVVTDSTGGTATTNKCEFRVGTSESQTQVSTKQIEPVRIYNGNAGAVTETWVINDNAAGELVTTQISFTSNGQKFTSIGAEYNADVVISLHYDNNEIALFAPGASSGFEFYNEAYRTIIFDTAPTGALLTWLQSNATKQAATVNEKDFLYGIPFIYNSGWKYNSWNITYTGNNRANIAIAGNAIVG